MEQLVANIEAGVRKVLKGGRSYLVATGTIIKEGVLDGSEGPIFYPKSSFINNADDWNGMPITVYHPKIDGKYVSARHPEVRAKQTVGVLLNAKANGDKIDVEYWFDEEDTKRVDYRVYSKLTSNTPMDVSTGLMVVANKLEAVATHKGKSYHSKVKSMRPDHLAILPDVSGACGISDGCGVLVNEKDGSKSVTLPVTNSSASLTNNKLTHTDVRIALSKMLKDTHGVDMYGYTKAWLVDVYDKEFIYELGEKLYRSKYTTDNRSGKVEMSGTAVEVRREITYKPVANEGSTVNDPLINNSNNLDNNSHNSGKGDIMNKDQMVEFLVGNCACWKSEGSKEILYGFDEARLTGLVEAAKKPTPTEVPTNNTVPAVTTPAPANTTPVNNTTNNNVVDPNTIKKPATWNEWMELAPPEARSAINNAMNAERREKVELIEKIVANTAEDKKAAYRTALATEPNEKLRMLAELVGTNQPTQTNNQGGGWDIPHTIIPNFVGGGATPDNQVNNASADSEPLLIPVVNWAELANN